MVDAVLGLIGTLLYPLFSIVFVIISLLQSLFYSFAGIGDNIQYGSTYSGNGETGMGFIPITGSSSDGGDASTGIVYFILNSNIVKNIFISIAILAIFLIIIFSTLAALKSIYSEKPKSWRDIVTNAVKGLTSFIILPVCCLLGVWVGNILLQAVAGATSQGGTMYLDRQLFLSCSYSANIYRVETFTDSAGDKSKQDAAYERIKETIEIYGLTNAYGGEVDATDEEGNTIKNLKNLKRGQNSQYYAQIVDQMYALNRIPIHNHITVGVGETGYHGYYQLWNINYLLLIVGGIFMMYVLVSVTYGMVKRLFILMMLFVISPAVCAMYPLDEGNAVKNWTGDVKKNITSAYGAVAGMNLFFCFAPVIKNINFSLSGAAWVSDIFFVSDIIQLILLICGLFCVNEFITMIVNYFSLGNAYGDGKSLRASAKGALKTNAKRVGGYVGAFTKGNAVRKEVGKGGFLAGTKTFFGETFGKAGKNAMADYGLDWNLKEGNKKAVEDYRKTYNDKIKAQKTERNIAEMNMSKADFVNSRIAADQAEYAEAGKTWNSYAEAVSRSRWESYFDKNKAKDTGKLSMDDYLKTLNISSEGDVANAIREIAKANNLNDKEQSALAEKIAVEYNKHRELAKDKPGKNNLDDKLMSAEDVIKERDKAIVREKTEEAKNAAFKGMTDKSAEVEAKTAEINAVGATEVEADYLTVKRMGIDTASAYATETDSSGALTSRARNWQEKIEHYNLYKENEELGKELKSFVQEYEATLRRSADSQNEEMKALFNSCADTIKNKLNEAIDPKAITEAIKAGTASSTKTKDQVTKIIEELAKIVP